MDIFILIKKIYKQEILHFKLILNKDIKNHIENFVKIYL